MSTQQQQSQQGGQQGSQQGGQQGQMNAANNVNITNGNQAPSMGQMQEGMGGLLTLQNMNQAFQDFMSPMVNTVRGIQDDGNQLMMNLFDSNPAKKAFEEATGVEPTSQGDIARETIAEQVADRTPDPVAVAEPTPEPVVEDNGWGNVKTDNDAINWALKKGDISQEDANWLRRWSSESVRAGRKKNIWATGGGGAQNFDASHSGLSSGNRAIAERFKNSIKGNWDDPRNIYAIEQGADFDGDGDVTNAEWKKHMEGGTRKKKPEEEEENAAGAIYNTKAARQIREAKLAALARASL